MTRIYRKNISPLYHTSLMKTVRKICFFALFSIAGIIGLFLLITGWFYITCPVYIFEEPKPFSGHKFYNPYQNVIDEAWMKCVFHLHTKSWMGLSNGENTSGEVMDVYRLLNYDVVAISDYMTVNRDMSNNHLHIPVYEHGYNIKKVHQLALGAQKVIWRDYIFKQNLHQKQHIIDLLKQNSFRVAVNHPSMRSSYPPNDFYYLAGYDLFEVQNGTHISETAWDAALSSGHPVWLIANDDAHTVNNPARVQREVTYVNAPALVNEIFTHSVDSRSLSRNGLSEESVEILDRLTQGVAFGVHFPYKKLSTIEEKLHDAEIISFPVIIQVYEDTLKVVWQQIMQKIECIGDNGKVLKTVTGSNTACYPICAEDTYIRVRLTSPEDIVYYLNPIVRCSDDGFVIQSSNPVNKHKTFRKRAISVFIFGTFVIIFAVLYKRLA